MSGRRRRPQVSTGSPSTVEDPNDGSVLVPNGALSYSITDPSYQGDLYVGAEWDWDENFIANAWDSNFTGTKEAQIGLQRGKDCGTWDGSGKFQWITLDTNAANNGSFEEDLWHSWKDQNQTITICFQAVLKVLGNTNTNPIKAGKLTVRTYSDSGGQTPLSPNDENVEVYEIELEPSGRFYIPFYSCAPVDGITEIGKNGGGNPVFSYEG